MDVVSNPGKAEENKWYAHITYFIFLAWEIKMKIIKWKNKEYFTFIFIQQKW